MSLAQVLEELPAFTVAERQLLVLRSLELDDPGLSLEDEKLISNRLDEHRSDPGTAVSLDAIKASIHSRLGK